jgi:hypothetical protein
MPRCHLVPAEGPVIAVLLLGGCGPLTDPAGSPSGVEFLLRLVPYVPDNQSPFDDVTEAELEIAPAVGDASLYALPIPDSGNTAQIEGLSEFEDAILTVRGYNAEGLVSRGRTLPLTLLDGDELEASLLISLVERVGWFAPLDEGLWAGALVPAGDGRFHLLGGLEILERGDRGSDAISTLDLGDPDESLAFVGVGTLPPWNEGPDHDGDTHTERMGFTPMQLTAGDATGAWLIAGGSGRDPRVHASEVTDTSFLFDAATGEVTPLEGVLGGGGRSLYQAVVDQRGTVVYQGGWAYIQTAGYISWTQSYDVYSPEDDAFETLRGTSAVGPVGSAGSAIDTDGTLFCGGALVGDTDGLEGLDWTATATCERVSLDLDFEALSPLPAPRAGLAMVTLTDGSVLATGGAPQGTAADAVLLAPAEDTAFLRSPDSGKWRTLSAHLELPRAGHSMRVLPDGRVLVVGGAPEWAPLAMPTVSYACAEIYDPQEQSFDAVDDCDADSDAASLEERAWDPMTAVDPTFGVLIAGGMSSDVTGSPRVGLFVPRR